MAKDKKKNEDLEKELVYKKESFFETASDAKIKKAFAYAEGYKKYLDNSKTERDAVKASIEYAKAHGYTEYKLGDKLKVGDKRYLNNRDKNFFMFKVGTEDIGKYGVKILASHIDSPRLDIKQNPLYESDGMAFLKTHYYGGVKKYQWTTIPLALHGIVTLNGGKVVDVVIGEDDKDPIFYINDLLIHLSREQMQKTMAQAIDGESLNVLVGGLPIKDVEYKDKIKLNVLKKLNEKYGMKEKDFLSAELTAVPALKARDVGLDGVYLAGYGHDDKVCSYPALTALGESKDTLHTSIVILADKEEIGSEGVTGMQCVVLNDLIDELAEVFNTKGFLVRANSKCLSADVTAGYDPNFKSVFEERNSAIMSAGTCLCKVTGSGGKGGASDASSELVGYITNLFDENDVNWQIAELGKVDAGGGGTVAKYIAKLNIDTLDIGVPVISMHAPYELISKADLYSTHEAFSAFLK